MCLTVKSNGIDVYILPDGSKCTADTKCRSPLELEKCPIGKNECDGDCFYYKED